jgi:hypothetical protein
MMIESIINLNVHPVLFVMQMQSLQCVSLPGL